MVQDNDTSFMFNVPSSARSDTSLGGAGGGTGFANPWKNASAPPPAPSTRGASGGVGQPHPAAPPLDTQQVIANWPTVAAHQYNNNMMQIVEKLERDLSEKEHLERRLRKEVEAKQAEVSERDESIADMCSNFERMMQRMRAARDHDVGVLNARIADLQDHELPAVHAQCEALQADRAQLKEDLSLERLRAGKLEAEVAALRGEREREVRARDKKVAELELDLQHVMAAASKFVRREVLTSHSMSNVESIAAAADVPERDILDLLHRSHPPSPAVDHAAPIPAARRPIPDSTLAVLGSKVLQGGAAPAQGPVQLFEPPPERQVAAPPPGAAGGAALQQAARAGPAPRSTPAGVQATPGKLMSPGSEGSAPPPSQGPGPAPPQPGMHGAGAPARAAAPQGLRQQGPPPGTPPGRAPGPRQPQMSSPKALNFPSQPTASSPNPALSPSQPMHPQQQVASTNVGLQSMHADARMRGQSPRGPGEGAPNGMGGLARSPNLGQAAVNAQLVHQFTQRAQPTRPVGQ